MSENFAQDHARLTTISTAERSNGVATEEATKIASRLSNKAAWWIVTSQQFEAIYRLSNTMFLLERLSQVR